MEPTLLVYQGVLVVVCIATGGVAVRAWRRREEPGAAYLAVMNVGIVFWTLFTLLPTFLGASPWSFVSLRLVIVFVTVGVFGLFAFTLEYTGRGEYLTRRTLAVLSVQPILTTVVVLTNGYHELMWTETALDPTAVYGVVRTFQAGFLVHTLYSYALLVVAVYMLGLFAVRSDFLYQKQVVAFLFAIFVPWIGNVLYIFTPVQYDLSQVGFAVTGISLGYAITSVGFLDITPVARNRVVETLQAAVFVIDTDGRLVDINDQGRQLLGVGERSVTGEPVSALLDPFPETAALVESITTARTDATFETTLNGRTFTVRISPLYDQRDLLAGRVVLVNDVTEQVQQQRELRQRNEQLDRFASVVSHDLRNPLTVASGKLELFRQTRDDDYLSDIDDSLHRMERLISDVLTLTRTGGDDIELTPVSIGAVAQAAWSNVETDASTLEVVGEWTLPAKRTLLMQLFENLFRNSVEHGSTGNRDAPCPDDSVEHGSTGSRPGADDAVEHNRDPVTVTVGPLGDGFFVEDDGVGIPESERADLFDEGVSGTDAGTGLGLMIVDQVASVHGWETTVTASQDGGARFEIQSAR
ncbi:histidine kinase N-terminal 7TM domain-containing protein [Haloarcula salinisoli]|uniref:histidine kinase n=1 Tax=Haloarcula salinisoli TaxID=2487746 RepID=A0A8J7YJS5_9EURY|nr:histidine kinase N-terminal 7TM domain-containing protein [Halomicroarcula salinisoli]MBX0303111.1 PAS domain-containing protein [Halomicroarcula salinisoli]